MKYKITPTGSDKSILVEATSAMEVASQVKALGISAKIVKYTPAEVVKVTCGWGKNAHSWETTKEEAVRYKNTCPQHRS